LGMPVNDPDSEVVEFLGLGDLSEESCNGSTLRHVGDQDPCDQTVLADYTLNDRYS